METAIDRLFLDYSVRRLRQLTGRIDECLNRLTNEQIWARGGENENAVGNLLLHVCGNVRQWIIANIGGKADVRERDREFSARGGRSKAELLGVLHATVEEALAILGSVRAETLTERRVIQGEDVSVLEAIYQVVQHFSMHVGQIIFATKAFTGSDLGFYVEPGTAHGRATP
jgi:uncharacterized damage-inducible protein DinB